MEMMLMVRREGSLAATTTWEMSIYRGNDIKKGEERRVHDDLQKNEARKKR